ncbi:MAG TPA: tRNA (adenosine(37)-N6)-threonylcarbamoyltransferase complex ATPase subunit type 1 TsaE [Gemmataceae bacterium]|jgi:tRNA threonylcarbamoyladenosine biosynthesis protein TsaE|nr:tRNA (adenosine(37)-N6)-threonylcarbamoyltransferase complex ATPase subunit type 1 TsaE [Gemmataceae bacterium]
MTNDSIDIPDLAATNAFGHCLAGLLFPGSVIALVGPLGAGKTHLVRAIAEGLGIADSRGVNSPTFVLIQEYQARMPIFHFDAYRLRNSAEFIDLGPHEYFEADGVCLIEWADKVEACLPKDYLKITIEITGENSRRFLVEGYGDQYERIVESWKKVKYNQE